jgi:ribose transport system ATP-binding protein
VADSILELSGISKRFGGVVALDRVDFELKSGESHGLIGENGAGKSTLMKILAGVHTDYEGELSLNGESLRFASPADAQARGIGMVYQELSAFSQLSVAENMFGRRLPTKRGFVNWSAMRDEAQRHIYELGLDIDVRLTMGALPVGNQQLVEIARVLFSGARVIILDEPTSALSPPETRRLFEFIENLKRQGKTLVFISHFLDDVLEVTDRVTVLRNGRHAATLTSGNSNKRALVELMIGAASAHEKVDVEPVSPSHADTPAKPPGEVVLSTRGLSRHGAFEDVSLSLRSGEILGLFAFMGAGQTELGRCLFGAERIDGGEILIDGKPTRLKTTTRAKSAGFAFVPEDRRNALMLKKEIFKNITLAHLAKLVPFFLNERRERALAKLQIEEVGIRPALPTLPVGALSGGNQQKVVLAKWLTQKPKVLILSEPTRGMDVSAKSEVVSIVRRLREQGVAILLVTTEPEAIVGLADRALVMRRGRVTAELSGESLSKQSLMHHA